MEHSARVTDSGGSTCGNGTVEACKSRFRFKASLKIWFPSWGQILRAPNSLGSLPKSETGLSSSELLRLLKKMCSLSIRVRETGDDTRPRVRSKLSCSANEMFGLSQDEEQMVLGMPPSSGCHLCSVRRGGCCAGLVTFPEQNHGFFSS